ncbi:MAG TPA: Rrf2 family transcriptional regulator [Candidatus Hydrogenedentes bacterium]|nr:Rrf2 family transcriptional regulator [Candidatus Hydrogenedentota bacterium]
MRITFKGDYAMKAILDLAMHEGEGPIQIHDLAKRINAPLKFFEQVLLDLKRGGFVESRRGKEGGYLLAKDPADITVGDVARFIDGPIEPIACLADDYANCTDMYRCSLRAVWQRVAQATSAIIDHVSFAELAQQTKARRDALEYTI